MQYFGIMAIFHFSLSDIYFRILILDIIWTWTCVVVNLDKYFWKRVKFFIEW